jgi:hypothetical protein
VTLSFEPVEKIANPRAAVKSADRRKPAAHHLPSLKLSSGLNQPRLLEAQQPKVDKKILKARGVGGQKNHVCVHSFQAITFCSSVIKNTILFFNNANF